jgi:hypothetical protein
LPGYHQTLSTRRKTFNSEKLISTWTWLAKLSTWPAALIFGYSINSAL